MRLAKALGAVKSTAAALTDSLAVIGERMPGLQQVTLSVPGASVTVSPSPPAPTAQPAATCPHCGR